MNIFKKRHLQLSDLSDADKKELAMMASLMADHDAKERPFIEQRQGVTIRKLADYGSFLEVGTGSVWATWRACHIVACVLVKSQLTAVTVDAEGKEVAPLSKKDEPYRIFFNPNPYDSQEDMIYQWVFHMMLTGGAKWLKDEVNGKGQPAHIYPLLPQYIEIEPDRKTKIKKFIYKVNGETIDIPPEQMIDFRRPHPSSTILGLGDVEAGKAMFQTLLGRNDLESKFIEAGAQPSGILTRKDAVADDDKWTAFVEKWKSKYGGRKNAGKTAFLNGEWMYLRLGLTHEEMQAIEREKWTVDQIFALHGVPTSLAGISNAANYATAKQDEINFRRFTCVPLLDMFVGRMNMSLASAYGEDIRYSYSLDGLIDAEQVTKEWLPLVKAGAMTMAELREKAGLSPSNNPLHDQYVIEDRLIPLEMLGMAGTNNAPRSMTDFRQRVLRLRAMETDE